MRNTSRRAATRRLALAWTFQANGRRPFDNKPKHAYPKPSETPPPTQHPPPPLFPLSEVAQGSPQLMLRSGRIVISSSSSLERALNPGGGARRPHPSPSPSSSRPFPLSLLFSSRRLTTPRRLRQRRRSRHAATTTAVPPSTLPMISLSRVEMSSA